MFESFYKLHPTPFRLTPDPHFFFESETHKRGLAYLRFAFYQREGFVAITGAPGTGKTELTLNLIEELPRNKVTLAKIVTTNLDADDLLDLVAAQFNIDIENVGKGSELKKLENFFINQARAGKQVLLIIDEAHNLSVKSLLELSMLENFQLDEKPLMQCFLLGQLPLEDKLNLPELEPLKQRVIASARLENLDQQETHDYIVHRLSKAGWNNNPVINNEAFRFIYHFTKGVPRKINSLCNRLLLHTYVESEHKISADTVNTVIQEMQQEAVWESLDVDFAEMKKVSESTSNSLDHSDTQPVLPRENKTPQAEMSFNNKSKERHNNPGEEIDVPVFLRKTQDPGSTSITKMLKEIREIDTGEPQLEDTSSTKHEHYQSKSRQNTRVTQPNTGDTGVATSQPATHRPVKRSSGLLDKELQFLASLAESTALATELPTTAPEKKPEPKLSPVLEPIPEAEVTTKTVDKQPEKNTKTIRKVIIDESAYDDEEIAESTTRKVIIDESVYDNREFDHTNYETDWQKSKAGLPILNDWRQTVIAGLVVGTLIMSISWLYESDSEQMNIVAVNQPKKHSANENLTEAEIFAPATPVNIELPSIGSSDSHADTNKVGSSSLAGSETPDADTSVAKKSVATTSVATASATETASATASSGNSKHFQSGELDNQLTQVLERSSPAPVNTTSVADSGTTSTTKATTSKNDNQSKLVALSNDKQSANPDPNKIMPVNSVSKNNNIESKPVERTIAPVTGRLASAPKVNDPKSVAMQKNKPDSALAELPTVSASKKATEHVPVSDLSVSQRPDTAGTSVSMLNSGRDSVNHRSEPAISKSDLATLLFRLSDAYRNGNLQELVMTFASDIKSSDGSDRQQMLKEYERLFNITDRRQLAIQDVKWSTNDRQMLGEGDFEVLIREKGATKYTTYQGKISFAVAKESDGIVIKKLDYDYGQ